MITDAEIREQGYMYFLEEAPDLLHTIQQELFTLSEDFSIAKVHKLMRASHTLKGGAANVGLEVIKMISHSLEDVFKAFYSPDVVLDTELETLLMQAYECLSLALNRQLTNSPIDNEELLQRSALVFAKLQEKLGDAYGDETHIPTSEELGFDIVKSIFESGVNQRLESLAETIKNPPDDPEFIEFLTSQAEVFLGLAESLNLPGLEEISQTIITALEANPQEVSHIALLALIDLQQAQKDVLAGDRTCGGAPSPEWQKLTTVIQDQLFPSTENFLNNCEEFYDFLTASSNTKNEQIKPTTAKLYLKVIYHIFGWFNHQQQIPKEQLELSLLIPKSEAENQIDYITNWLNEFLNFVEDEEDSYSLCLYRHGVILIILLAVTKFQYISDKSDSYHLLTHSLQTQIRELAQEYKNYPPVNSQEKNWLDSFKLRQLLVFQEISPTDSHINNDLVEEIWGGEADAKITNEEVDKSLAVSEEVVTDIVETDITPIADAPIQTQAEIPDKFEPPETKNYRKPTFIRVDVDRLQRLNYLAGELLIFQKRRTLHDEKIGEMLQQLLQQFSRHQETLHQLRDLPLQMQNFTSASTQNFASVKFDSLEMDIYSDFHLSLHEAMEETMQLQETTESLELLLKDASQISDQKQNLAFSIVDNLVEARLSPLGTVFNRLPQMVKQLATVYHKLVELRLTGTDVLVDKAIAEKLYEPLLHLVRNAFDHGIESPEVRQAGGKPEQGTIEICAYHQGSQTVIEVRDDGKGLNFERIRQKAVDLGFIGDDDPRGYSSHSEPSLLDLMFFPGLSTADQVNEVSGRGMGLDIVRSQLEALNGSISVQSSPHQGTTFILKIPFSMTTDTLMLVQAGGVVYALLLDSIAKILIPSTQQVKEFEGKRVLHWNTDDDDNMVNLHRLSDLIDYHGSLSHGSSLRNHAAITNELGVMKNPVLLLKRNQGVVGLEVDQIIGEQELVIRPLGSAIAPPKYVYGCSSLANGNLILVIDGTLLLEFQARPIKLDVPALPISDHSQLPALSGSITPTIPLLSASAPAQLTQSLKPNHKTAKVILVVDDAISLRRTLSLTLEKYGYQVIQAQNGAEALEQLQCHPEIEVILSDLEMPRMNGFELLSHLRQNPSYVNIPIVVLTSRSAEKHRQLATELGANAYFTKPYLEHELISTLNDLNGEAVSDSTSFVEV
ncbi:response regulator [Nodularia harveyana UHCC-0300]|uniref:histidine kinase n=1 Tax=Nodularia harveyana UHCC-0300 TaxID=2974287 RepID=A0ABU5U8F2_9CYAN|nr:response regulator [Nodularia harveyana]MEA5579782.1 response regulator [Nodularia harveyana UHCC-0300]